MKILYFALSLSFVAVSPTLAQNPTYQSQSQHKISTTLKQEKPPNKPPQDSRGANRRLYSQGLGCGGNYTENG